MPVNMDALNKLLLDALKQANDKIQELYDTELSDEDKKLISVEEFASHYTIDFNVEDKLFTRTGEFPKMEIVLRLKTPEEILAELENIKSYKEWNDEKNKVPQYIPPKEQKDTSTLMLRGKPTDQYAVKYLIQLIKNYDGKPVGARPCLEKYVSELKEETNGVLDVEIRENGYNNTLHCVVIYPDEGLKQYLDDLI